MNVARTINNPARIRSSRNTVERVEDEGEDEIEDSIRLPDALRFEPPSLAVQASPAAALEIGLQQMAGGQAIPEFSHLYAVLERRLTARLGERGAVISGNAVSSAAIPGFRRLGYSGTVRAPYKPSCIIGVTSAVPQEGKTTIALHLAASAARDTYKNVALFDLAMGEEDLCRRLNLALGQGMNLMDCLEGAEGNIPTMRLADSQNLFLFPAGRRPQSAARTSRSPRIGDLFEAARQAFDIVIVDLPAVTTDNALPIIDHLDGVVMVTRAGATPHKVVQRAVEEIGRDRVLGVVLNQVPVSNMPRFLRKRLLGG